ncbi:MAG TPA: M48 family metalloprotease [Methylophilaceae bacterium]|nr:M48 family metalloprotease [Methylophilaceae bacterium]
MKRVYLILMGALSLSAPLAIPAANDLPELGDVSATVLSPLDEQRIADQIMRDVMTSNQVVQDVEISDYVQNLGYRLAASGPDKRQPFKFFVVRDNSINAFAMPGGVIGVHTGLILAANSESEVAGVLGHEIGHVVQHHMARMLAQQKRDSITTMATMALAILAARANPQLGGGAMTAASAGAVQKQLDYTREHEREADRVGLQILDSAGFDTRGMPAFFETLQKGSRFVEGSAPSFLRTHPLTVERIADVRSRVEQTPYRQVPDSAEFQYVRAKLLATLGTPRQAVAVFQGNLQDKKYTSEAAQHYGLAQAYMRNNDVNNASKELAWLRQNAPHHAMIETLAANIEVARKNPAEAAKQYTAALNMFPGHRALIYGYAEHFLATGQADKALKLIQEKQPMYPDDPYFYELMSRVYTVQGKSLLRHQAQGEAYFRRYNWQGALEQMDLAAKAGDGDFYQQSIVEARLKQMRQVIMDQPKR